MNHITYFSIIICGLFSACNSAPGDATLEKWKEEIMETELAFASMAKVEGISEAFLAYAAEDAVLMRNNSLVVGKSAIRSHFGTNIQGIGTLSWEPTYIDVSKSGDLAYTYGGYVYATTDSTGQANQSEGIFHTVWKRQADGSWKFVWD